MKRFLKMLNTPEWARHPYREFWKHELQGKKLPNAGLFTKNLPVLRNTKLKTFPRGSRPIFWELGNPDSAVENPFDPSHEQACLPNRGAGLKASSSLKSSHGASKGTTSKAKTKAAAPVATSVRQEQVSAPETAAQEPHRPSVLSAPGSYGGLSTLSEYGIHTYDSAAWSSNASGSATPYGFSQGPQNLVNSGSASSAWTPASVTQAAPSAPSVTGAQRKDLKRGPEEEFDPSEGGTSNTRTKRTKKGEKKQSKGDGKK
ncbi:hypothetical protein D6C78_10799 [Aureobasidium pullulans]|uniref:Uncharacterized protein n=1 Tax=Aureobasidium pullulans TaxID=5580 RepID=A0A4T0B9J4_AURPU|nr:hypothetical protein D6C78_10799 [Aureobasidium pullulans]